MPRYYRYLGELLEEGVERISSNDLSHRMMVTASQIRQDLNNFGGFGQQGYGYNVKFLYDEIGKILGLNETHNIIMIGAGNLGQAITNYVKFERFGFIITALFDRELEAILKLPCNWKEFNIKNDSTIYYKGIIEKNNISLNIIAAACSRMGMSASASLTTKICMTFKPKYIFMTGITAGIEGKCKFGDILVADPAWDWGNGKLTIDKEGNPIFNSSPNQIKIDKRYRELLRKISVNRSYVDQIRNNWNEDIEHILSLHIGPVASGAAVLEDPLIASSIKKQHRELLGIEMEIYGMMLAAELRQGAGFAA
jgi:NADH/NAD ratio-sensing transcriptional regulator Rex